jgi:hypothetical protein
MNHILNKDQFKQYQYAFRQRSRAKQATMLDHVLYNLLRGKKLERGFTPITNKNKLAAGRSEYPWRTITVQFIYRCSIENFAQQKRYFAGYGGDVPMCVYYEELITQKQWQEIVNTIGEYKWPQVS